MNKNLFEQVADFKNLHSAYFAARRCKRYRSYILKFEYNLEENLLTLKKELLNKTYHHGGYHEFIITDSKKRIIKAPLFRDRIVHHALCNIIEPILDRGFIYDSYACRKGKGVHVAVKRLESFLKSCSATQKRRDVISSRVYCLKCDISKYFENVDHKILLELLEKKIQNEDILWLLREIINSNAQGIPIGNLTSQLFANVYLNELDHFIKRVLGERYYIRYMDDFLILNTNKWHLRETKERLRMFLCDRLKLELHPKKAEIFPADKGIDFLGYVVRNNKRFLRKSTVRRFLKKKRRYYKTMVKNGQQTEAFLQNVYNSWRGYIRFADSYKLIKNLSVFFHQPL